MTKLRFEQYSDESYRDQFYELNLEYLTWVDKEAYTNYGINVNPTGTVKEYLDSVFDTFTEIQPPEGIIYLILDNKTVVGMGVLKKLDDSIAEIKRMYLRPEYRGKGFGKEMLKRLDEKARELEYSAFRLDTGAFMPAAQHVYRKGGFVEIDYYAGNEWEKGHADSISIYMEKKLTP